MSRARTIADFGDGIATADIDDGAVTAAKINSAVALGITMADQWRLTTNYSYTATADADITSNWERTDEPGFNYIGSGMSEASGVFTFPETGIYKVESVGRFSGGGNSFNWASLMIYVSTDGGSTYNQATETYAAGGASDFESQTASTFVDVTSTANVKIKFVMKSQGNIALDGNTDENHSHVTFIRLGDT